MSKMFAMKLIVRVRKLMISFRVDFESTLRIVDCFVCFYFVLVLRNLAQGVQRCRPGLGMEFLCMRSMEHLGFPWKILIVTLPGQRLSRGWEMQEGLVLCLACYFCR